MAEDLITFNIRLEKSQFELKIKTPNDVSGFIKKLKNELKVKDENNIVVLCPTPEGKMMEIDSDDDIEFLKKTKLCYNAVSKEIYCSVELVVIIIHQQLPDEPKVQFMILSNKVDKLAGQFDELSLSLNTKIEYSMENIRSMLLERFHTDDKKTKKKTASGDHNITVIQEKYGGYREKKPKNDQTKLSNTASSNDGPSVSENLNQQTNPDQNTDKSIDFDTSLKMLVAEGFTNTIQNIIVLKRFDGDYFKALSYLKLGI